MKNKKIWKDLSFWVLLGVNGYLVWYYYQRPSIFGTLLWLYWAQSMLTGAFNVLDILTVRKVNTNEMVRENGRMVKSSFTRRIPSALFFMFHFGFFHVGYFVFLYTIAKFNTIDWVFLRYFFYIFLGGQIIGFIQHKIEQWNTETSLSKLFITPYIRIVPMHLTIICSTFFAAGTIGVFLVLKAFADVVMYIVTKPATGNTRSTSATTTIQQSLN